MAVITRPKFFVHVGLAKTGTTSFQNTVFENTHNDYCQGIWYPTIGMARNTNEVAHHNLARQIIPVRRDQYSRDCGTWEELIKAWKAKRCTTLISSEALSFDYQDRIKDKLIELNNYADIEIILVWRNIPELSESLYFQEIRKFFVQPIHFENYYDAMFTRMERLGRSIINTILRYKEAGIKCTVFPYTEDINYRLWAYIFGKEIPEFPRVNVSYNIFTKFILTSLTNIVFREFSEGTWNTLIDEAQKYNYDKELSNLYFHRGDYYFIYRDLYCYRINELDGGVISIRDKNLLTIPPKYKFLLDEEQIYQELQQHLIMFRNYLNRINFKILPLIIPFRVARQGMASEYFNIIKTS